MTAAPTEVEDRLARLERSGPPQLGVYDGRGVPLAPTLAPDSPAAQMAEADQRRLAERRAEAAAEEDRQRAERERLAAQAALDEAIRADLYASNAPRRDRAIADLKVAGDKLAVIDRKRDALLAEMSTLREVIARFAPSS
ncbi:MAG TPA: hypothetical protein VMR25_02000 [Planctomycetaceae bacterium]|jgi:hypothetical protein|nr:hypothetical protein [Planctomycetaceae bacterium]